MDFDSRAWPERAIALQARLSGVERRCKSLGPRGGEKLVSAVCGWAQRVRPIAADARETGLPPLPRRVNDCLRISRSAASFPLRLELASVERLTKKLRRLVVELQPG